MEMEAGKLFIGGISWETSEERLREYFQAFGEVLEAVIMRDRTTGRARGFGFIVFANASVAEKVVRERHIIDGRTVEAKKAVPRDDHQTFTKINGSLHGSPGPVRTKKIFVGGLASTVTESDFKRYFDQFGIVTDVVVMYDHNTLRPRGFGFITYDSEESVDRVLIKTFHELNGKMVEVKRAVPKELSHGPARSPSSGYSYGLNRTSSFFSCPNPTGGYGMRTVGRSGYPPYSPGNHSMGLELGSGLSLNGMDYSYFGGSSSSTNRSAWGDVKTPNYITNSVNSNDFLGFGIGNGGLVGGLGNIGEIWGGSPVSAAKGRENIVCGGVHGNFGGMAGYTRDDGGNAGSTSLSSFENSNVVGGGGFGNLYGGDSFYSDHSWHASSRELVGSGSGSGSFNYGLAGAVENAKASDSVGYIGDYGVARSNRGIAA